MTHIVLSESFDAWNEPPEPEDGRRESPGIKSPYILQSCQEGDQEADGDDGEASCGGVPHVGEAVDAQGLLDRSAGGRTAEVTVMIRRITGMLILVEMIILY